MNRFQPKPNKHQQYHITPAELPKDGIMAIYPRQSTKVQLERHTTSTEMQTDDLVAYAKRLGMTDENIVLFDQDLGISGRMRIDQREGLSLLFDEIEKGKVKSILVFLEDRLFRDEKQIQPNIFIDFCRQHNVLVLTPYMTYDFTIDYHRKLFRWKCEEAADYLRDYVMVRLGGAKRRNAEQGLYDGRRVAFGYIIDCRQTIIVDGLTVKNPTYKKYIEYIVHADIIRRIFARYIQLNGKLAELYRELCQERVLFPAFTDVDKKAIGSRGSLEVEGGYHITKTTLQEILTNITYIGYWTYNGVVYPHNHVAIVDEETFWYAFNRLSGYTIDGKENTAKVNRVRYQRQESRFIPALLKDCIETRDISLPVYVQLKNNSEAYYFIQANTRPTRRDFRSARVELLDKLYTEKLLEHLRDSQSYEHYETFLKRRTEERSQKEKRLNEQLAQINEECKGLRVSLRKTTLTNAVREALEGDLEILLTDRAMIQASLDELTKGEQLVSLDEYHTLVAKLAPKWDTLTFTKKKMLVAATTKRVIFDSLAPHFIELTIEWDNPTWGGDTAIIWRKRGGTPEYTENEDQIIRDHYPKTDRKVLLEMLPNRSWYALMHRGVELKIKRGRRSEPNVIPDFLSMEDYEFALEHGLDPQSLQMETQVIWSLPTRCRRHQR